MSGSTNIMLQLLIGVLGLIWLNQFDEDPAMNSFEVKTIEQFDRWPLHHGVLVKTPEALQLFSQTGVRIAYPDITKIDGKWHYGGGEPSSQAIQQVVDNFKHYPTDMIRSSTIKWVILTPELLYDGREMVTAIGDQENALWINTTRAANEGGIGSFVTYAVYGHYVGLEAPLRGPDYHGNAYLSRAWGSSDDPCFVSAYAGYNGAADRGEIYRHMVADPDRLNAKARGNSCLRAKIEQVRTEINQRKPELLPSE